MGMMDLEMMGGGAKKNCARERVPYSCRKFSPFIDNDMVRAGVLNKSLTTGVTITAVARRFAFVCEKAK